MKRTAQWIETVFDAAYLLFAAGASFYFFATAGGNANRQLYGAMPALLALGDGCHLVPRVLSFFMPASSRIVRARALGKCAASVTMTLFYMVLAYTLISYYHLSVSPFVIAVIWVLGILRIVLSIYPLRQWTHPDGGFAYPLLRNIPFILLGILTAAFSLQSGSGIASPLAFMWLAILLSFAFYIPVVFYAEKRPYLGMLMLPKTVMYVWMICMGMRL